jgi:phosphoglucosamine mutase
MKYFGTDGIRNIARTGLKPEFVYKVAKAGVEVLTEEKGKKAKIIIGRDTRISGNLIESSLISGFLSSGANVENIGIAPTPAVAYLTKKNNADMSVVISASHNSFEYNGIKFFSNKGTKIPDEIENRIETYIDEEKKVEISDENIGICEYNENRIDEYIEFVCDLFKKDIQKLNRKNFSVGIDTANGATYDVAEKIFKQLGINYKIINNSPNGININKNCGSTHMEELKKFVVENNLSIGIAYDGDGDRCLTVDEKGNEINGDIVLALIADYLKKKEKLKDNRIIATVMSNLGLKKYAEKNGIELIQTKVGDRYVLEEMLENGGNFGGEQSGHVILADYNLTGDGIVTSLMIVKILLESQQKYSEICNIIDIYPQILINVKVKEYDMDKYPEIDEKIKQIEKELNGDGRVLIRKSGTEPLIRVMIEGKNQEYIEKSANEIADIIKKYMK